MPDNFRTSIELYCAAAVLSPSAFGTMAANDDKLLFDMRRGRRLRPALYERVAAYMSANVPA